MLDVAQEPRAFEDLPEARFEDVAATQLRSVHGLTWIKVACRIDARPAVGGTALRAPQLSRRHVGAAPTSSFEFFPRPQHLAHFPWCEHILLRALAVLWIFHRDVVDVALT